MRSQWKIAALSPALLGFLFPVPATQAQNSVPTMAPSAGVGDRPNEQQVARLVESLRAIAKQSSTTKSPTLYSEWRVSQKNIAPWSKQCLNAETTPQEFDQNPSTASKVVTCVVSSVLTTELKASEQDEVLAVRRTAAWWMTGDASRYNSPGTAAYTQRILSAYQSTTAPSASIAPIQPIQLQPIQLQPIATSTVTPAPVMTPAPVSSPAVGNNPAAVSQVPEKKQPTPKNTEPKKSAPATQEPKQPAGPSTDKVKPVRAGRSTAYDRYMDAGYDAEQAKNYKTALLFFRRALDERPNDNYAVTAIQNTEPKQFKKDEPAPKVTPSPTPTPSNSVVVPTAK